MGKKIVNRLCCRAKINFEIVLFRMVRDALRLRVKNKLSQMKYKEFIIYYIKNEEVAGAQLRSALSTYKERERILRVGSVSVLG